MLVLEHATFASPKNEAAVVSLAMPAGHAAADGRGGASRGSSGCPAAGDERGVDLGGQPGDAGGGSGSTPFPLWLVRNLAVAVSGAGASSPPASQVPSLFRELFHILSHAGV